MGAGTQGLVLNFPKGPRSTFSGTGPEKVQRMVRVVWPSFVFIRSAVAMFPSLVRSDSGMACGIPSTTAFVNFCVAESL